jgi:selenocysteine lyase/cysteine desulfurase
MHGLNTIVRLNKVQQDFVDEILATPYEDTNLLEVWQQWKEQQKETSNVNI